jgi:hypothetical protein
VLETHYLELALVNSYFDFDDYQTPIKTYLEDLNRVGLVPDLTHAKYYEIQQNTAELKENMFFNMFSQEKEFYSIGDRHDSFENFNFYRKSYASIYFKLSQKSEHYERTVFTLFDMFGMLGGIFEILSKFGMYFVSLFSVKLLNNILFSKLYQIRVDKAPSFQLNTRNHGNKLLEKSFNTEMNKYEENKTSLNISHTGNESEVLDICSQNNEELLENVKKELINRRQYSYSFKNIFYSLFCK